MNVKFLTVVWGARYVKEFASLSLPSYLSEGNLTLLAKETSLEIVIMTTEESVNTFEEKSIFQKLKSICPVKFIYIDDLITTGLYGVTLTLAYARGIQSTGAEQTNTHFIFMNSDFILADGGMKTLLERFRQGENCIMAASLRVRSEPVLPLLQERLDKNGTVMNLPPREAVRMTLDHLHPTVIAKTVTQNLITCSTHNQIYWGVDENTLLGRSYLIFMLAIKPEAPLGAINSYCDYGFVPELVPSGDIHVIEDSDDFFMMELSPSDQEKEFLRFGAPDFSDAADKLSFWTTKEHRFFAEHDTIFHASDIPAKIGQYKQLATNLIGQIKARMSPPVMHVDHYYWSMGVKNWWERRKNQIGNADLPLEHLPRELKGPAYFSVTETPSREAEDQSQSLSEPKVPTLSEHMRAILIKLVVNLFSHMKRAEGELPNIPIWHHLYQDSEIVNNWIDMANTFAMEMPVLIVHDGQAIMAHNIEKKIKADVIFTTQIDENKPLNKSEYSHLLFLTKRENVKKCAQYIDKISEYLNIKNGVSIFIELENYDQYIYNFTSEITVSILPKNWLMYNLDAIAVGGRRKHFLRKLSRLFRDRIVSTTRAQLVRSVFATLGWIFVTGLTTLDNLLWLRNKKSTPQFATSVLITMTKRP